MRTLVVWAVPSVVGLLALFAAAANSAWGVQERAAFRPRRADVVEQPRLEARVSEASGVGATIPR